MIHRAPFGSLERFIAILLEQYQGKLPFWLSPEQIKILPISDKFGEYSEKINSKLLNLDLRCSIDNRSESLGKKIKEAQLNHIPYMIIIGQKEMETDILSIRSREGSVFQSKLEDFLDIIK